MTGRAAGRRRSAPWTPRLVPWRQHRTGGHEPEPSGGASGADLNTGYRAAAPLLLQVGEDDDWTPPEPCRRLAARASGAPVIFHAYPGGVHGFDGRAPVALRRDLPNGTRPGQGVLVGGQERARELSRKRLEAFIAERWLPGQPGR